MESEIAEWYRGKDVFITGATGFMGKVLVEKLLRSCPDIGTIYVLVREKKNVPPGDRFETIMRSSAFDAVRAKRMDRKDWLHPIPGDVGLANLGISSENRRLLQDRVSVVFHVAATVRFDEPLRVAAALNVEGTRALLELCLGMTSLSAVVHVSTAYANCTSPVIDERVYPPPADPDVVKSCIADLSDDLLELATPRLIGDHPNTYTFTKALGEHVVAGYSTKLPIVIVRPSIVLSSWREPIPGWVDNLNGPTGLVVGAGKGLLKSMYGKGELVADLIPVDTCVNLFLAAAWEMGVRKSPKLVPNIRVYNCVSQPFKSLSWNEFVSTIDSCTKKYAMKNVFMSPKIRMTDSRLKHTLIALSEQTVPAILADVWTRCLGETPRIQHHRSRIDKMTGILEFFTTHEFEFGVANVEELKRRLNPSDQVIFNIDVTEMNWQEYIASYFLGIQRHVMNEKEETIPKSRKLIPKWNLTNKAIQIGLLAVVAFSYSQDYFYYSHWSNFYSPKYT